MKLSVIRNLLEGNLSIEMETTTVIILGLVLIVILLCYVIYSKIKNTHRLEKELSEKSIKKDNLLEKHNYLEQKKQLSEERLEENRRKIEELSVSLKEEEARNINLIEKNNNLEARNRRLEERADSEKEKLDALQEKYTSLEKEHNYLKGQRATEYKIAVSPFREIHVDKGFIYDDEYIAIGYQYQLFVNGIPCFEPHITIIDSMLVKELNREKLDYIIKQIGEASKSAAGIYLKGDLNAFRNAVLTESKN